MNIINLSLVIFAIFLSYAPKAIDPNQYTLPVDGCAGRPNSPAPIYSTNIINTERIANAAGKRSYSASVPSRFYEQDEQRDPPSKKPK